MNKNNLMTLIPIILVIVIFLIHFVWWVPQKWEACSNQFDNIILRLMCMD